MPAWKNKVILPKPGPTAGAIIIGMKMKANMHPEFALCQVLYQGHCVPRLIQTSLQSFKVHMRILPILQRQLQLV